MSLSPRYAVYYAPAEEHPLWKLGSEWLGRNAYTGDSVERREFPGFKDRDIDRLTSSPAHYGFHATMKAPFELRDGKTETQLLAHLETFSNTQNMFDVRLAVHPLGEFLALRLTDNKEAMQQLHEACVREFDSFRAPLSPEDIERRRKASLSPTQDARMLEWGYPYIFDEFRWHMTLSNRILSNSTREKVISTLTDMFEEVLADPLRIDGIAIYRQVDRNVPFNIIGRARFPAFENQPV